MIRLTRLKIDRYRRTVPGTELRFDEGINVLLGKNGTGKTTLLNLIAMCMRFDLSPLAKEEFALEFELKAETWTVRVAVENRKSAPLAAQANSSSLAGTELDTVVDRTLFEQSATLDLWLAQPKRTLRLEATPSELRIKSDGAEDLSPLERLPLGAENKLYLITLFFVLVGSSPDAEHDSATVGTLVEIAKTFRKVYRFDESLAMFRAMVGRTDDEAPHGSPASFAIQGNTTSGYKRKESHLVPEPVVKNACERHGSDASLELTIQHQRLDFLREFVRILDLESATMTVSLLRRDIEGDLDILKMGNFKFFFRFKDGSIITHDLLSYGQKRLLAFLYYLDCTPHVVVADELVNGLHHEWIEACLVALSGRQAFLTSQNPLLLDYLSFDSAEKAERCFITCKAEPHESRNRMRWANMSHDDASSFYRGYLAGIQHVSEILRTEGLW